MLNRLEISNPFHLRTQSFILSSVVFRFINQTACILNIRTSIISFFYPQLWIHVWELVEITMSKFYSNICCAHMFPFIFALAYYLNRKRYEVWLLRKCENRKENQVEFKIYACYIVFGLNIERKKDHEPKFNSKIILKISVFLTNIIYNRKCNKI